MERLKLYLLFLLLGSIHNALKGQTFVTIGNETSIALQSISANPIYRQSGTSSTLHSKSIHLITEAQLSAAGLPTGVAINSLAFYKANNGVVAGTNQFTLNVYLKNSSATSLASGTEWATMIAGATLAYTQNVVAGAMPTTAGFWQWNFQNNFTYSGGAIEIYVEWMPNGTVASPYTSNSFTWQYSASAVAQAMGTVGTMTIPNSQSTYLTQNYSYNVRLGYPSAACSGTPTPGNTISTVDNACTGQNFTLSLQNATVGSGISYQWQSSTDGTNYANISSAINSSLTTMQTVATYYRCRVTCGGNTGTSSALQVGMSSFINCYCLPNITIGTTDDGITNVTLGSLNNNSGIAAPYYTNYSSPIPNLARTVQQTLSITFGADITQYSAAWIDYNQNGSFETTENIALAATNPGGLGTSTFNFTVPNDALLGNTKMRVVGGADAPYTNADACTNKQYGEIEDYTINITAAPSCSAPSSLTNIITNATSVNHTWVAPALPPSNGYEWAFTTSVTPPSSGTATTSTSSNSTGLVAGTTYYLHVRSNCGGTFSPWATSAAASLSYCIPSPSNVDAKGITEVIFGTVNNNTASISPEVGNYADYSSLASYHPQASVVNVTTIFQTLIYPYYTYIWIDWNKDFDFDDPGELVASGLASNAGVIAPTTHQITLSFTVPGSAVLGSRRMRIGSAASNNPSPCYGGTFGSFEDYTLEVTTGVACAGTPTGVVITPSVAEYCTVGSSNLLVTTTSGGTSLSYQWQSSPAGTNTFTNIIGANDTYYAATNINTSTDFRCIVSCGGNSSTSNIATITITATPANDDICNATVVTTGTVYSNTTQCATVQIGEPTIACNALNNTVWYRYTPTVSGYYKLVINTPTASLVNNGFWVAMYTSSTACPTPTLSTVIPCTDNFFNVGSMGAADSVGFNLTAGNTYFIQLDGFNGAYGAYTFQIKPAGVAAGISNSCLMPATVVDVSPSNGNANTWLQFRDRSGDIYAELNAQNNDLANVSFNMFKHTGAQRYSLASPYLDRNFSITPQLQPNTAVKLRMYFTEEEFFALKVASSSSLTPSGLVVTKNSQPCSGAFTRNLPGETVINTGITSGSLGTNHYIEFNTPSFSSFWIHFPNSLNGTLSLQNVQFTAKQSGNANTILIDAISIANFEKFEIEKSKDGLSFQKIATIPASFGIVVNGSYRFQHQDFNPYETKSMYRVKITYNNGEEYYTTIATVERTVNSNLISSVYPNPTSGIIKINIANNNQIKISIRNMEGNVLMERIASNINELEIDMTRFSSGMYIVEAMDIVTNQKSFHKLTKQ